jgi:hypothetical protein
MEFPESTMASDIENVWVTINETLEKQK